MLDKGRRVNRCEGGVWMEVAGRVGDRVEGGKDGEVGVGN